MKRFLSFFLLVVFTLSIAIVNAKAVKKTVKAKKKTATEKPHKEKSDSTDTKKKSKKEPAKDKKKPVAKVNPDEPVTKPTLRDGSPDLRYKANADAAKMHVQKDDE